MDHYEKQLYSLFKNYDYDNSGALDHEALTSLCDSLQLEERGIDLVNKLVGESPDSKISFPQFRDGLLLILGDEFSNNPYGDELQNELDSPGREVSPKYVSGSKKYGRRSRPQINLSSPQNDVASNSNENKVQRSLSYSEVGMKKRKSEKLKRCTSFPGNKENLSVRNGASNRFVDFDEVTAICTDLGIISDQSMLRRIFDNLTKDSSGKVAVDDFLYRVECEIDDTLNAPTEKSSLYFGECQMEKIQNEEIVEMWELAGIQCAQQLLSDLGFHEPHINISELLTVLDEEIKMVYNQKTLEGNTSLLHAALSLHQYEIRLLKLEVGHIVAERDKLRNDLTDANLRAQMIAQEVDENQTKMETSLRNRIQQGEQKHLDHIRDISNQFLSDKDALSNTITKNEKRIFDLESDDQKHRTLISNLQHTNERLEKEVTVYQEQLNEIERMKSQLMTELKSIKSERDLWQSEEARTKSNEISILIEKLSEVQVENKTLKDMNDELHVEVESLQSKISNSTRSLSFAKTTCAVDISGEEAASWSAECDSEPFSWGSQTDVPVGYGGVKRRNNSPNKDANVLMSEEESPRICKVRKCHKKKSQKETKIFNDVFKCASESGLECDGDSSDGSSGIDRINIEEILTKMKSNKCIPVEYHIPLIKYLTQICEKLKNIINVQACSCNPCLVKHHLRIVCNQLLESNCLETYDVGLIEVEDKEVEVKQLKTIIDELRLKIDDKNKEWFEEKEKLVRQCSEFERSIDQLRTEYEKCEDYWQTKLEEEREIFDQEQRINDEKFNELVVKMTEYEQQFTPQERTSGPLSTIEEKYSLERQFTDLEDEFQSYKRICDEELKTKNVEIDLLTQQLKHLENAKINIISDEDNLNSFVTKLDDEIQNQIDVRNYRVKMEDAANVEASKVIESPIEYLWNQKSIELPICTSTETRNDSTRDYQNPAFGTKNMQTNDPHNFTESQYNASIKPKVEWDKSNRIINPIRKPDSPIRCRSADAIKNKNRQRDILNDIRQPASMNSELVMLNCADLENHLRQTNGKGNNYNFFNGGSSSMPEGFASDPSVSRIMVLEQRCQQLQTALWQQQAYADTLVKQAWSSAQVECNVLRARLAAADLLVQQLYLDNCQLLSALSAAPPSHA